MHFDTSICCEPFTHVFRIITLPFPPSGGCLPVPGLAESKRKQSSVLTTQTAVDCQHKLHTSSKPHQWLTTSLPLLKNVDQEKKPEAAQPVTFPFLQQRQSNQIHILSHCCLKMMMQVFFQNHQAVKTKMNSCSNRETPQQSLPLLRHPRRA